MLFWLEVAMRDSTWVSTDHNVSPKTALQLRYVLMHVAGVEKSMSESKDLLPKPWFVKKKKTAALTICDASMQCCFASSLALLMPELASMSRTACTADADHKLINTYVYICADIHETAARP